MVIFSIHGVAVCSAVFVLLSEYTHSHCHPAVPYILDHKVNDAKNNEHILLQLQ